MAEWRDAIMTTSIAQTRIGTQKEPPPLRRVASDCLRKHRANAWPVLWR
jgi:hypothetical protein